MFISQSGLFSDWVRLRPTYDLCWKMHYITLGLVACFWMILYWSLCLLFCLFADRAAAAAAASVRWGLLPRPQALQGGGGLWGVGVRQLRGHPPRPRPGLGVVHQCSSHPAGPVCPVEGRQPHRLDRGAHLLRGLLHRPETVWGEAKPRPLQCVDSDTQNLSFCFCLCASLLPEVCQKHVAAIRGFIFVPAEGSRNCMFLPEAANTGLTLMQIWIFVVEFWLQLIQPPLPESRR